MLLSRPGQFQKWLSSVLFLCKSRLAATNSYIRIDKSLDRFWIISKFMVVRQMWEASRVDFISFHHLSVHLQLFKNRDKHSWETELQVIFSVCTWLVCCIHTLLWWSIFPSWRKSSPEFSVFMWPRCNVTATWRCLAFSTMGWLLFPVFEKQGRANETTRWLFNPWPGQKLLTINRMFTFTSCVSASCDVSSVTCAPKCTQDCCSDFNFPGQKMLDNSTSTWTHVYNQRFSLWLWKTELHTLGWRLRKLTHF